MKKIFLIIGFYISTKFVRFYSFFINVFYWIIHFNQLNNALLLKRITKRKIKTIEDVKKEISRFKWKKEKVDWVPWVITILHRQLKDDCDGAAVYGKFLFEECLKFSTDIYSLYRKDGGHAVAITKDKIFMISNDILYTFKSNDEKSFEKELLNNPIFLKPYEFYII